MILCMSSTSPVVMEDGSRGRVWKTRNVVLPPLPPPESPVLPLSSSSCPPTSWLSPASAEEAAATTAASAGAPPTAASAAAASGNRREDRWERTASIATAASAADANLPDLLGPPPTLTVIVAVGRRSRLVLKTTSGRRADATVGSSSRPRL